MLNRIAFDSAVGKGGVLARLKLAARANQIRVELGAGQTATGGRYRPG
ncbi:hypothetical protein [Xylophilus sp.]|nr:hypothetical protein [Xylophilus sp.]KAF1049745.1 MAG: hypothetical protein GAK38_00408 [Xylophilus sp.]